MKKHQKGFSLVETLIVIVVIGIVGVIGWLVYDQQTSTQQSSTPKTYDDDFVSLTYPDGWKVRRDDNENLPGAKALLVTSPGETRPFENYANKKTELRLNIFLNGSNDDLSGCANCKVIGDVVALNNDDLPNAKLIFTEGNTPTSSHDDKADVLVITNHDLSSGDRGYDALKIGVKSLLIWVDFSVVDGGIFEDNFTGIDTFKSTQGYKDLVTILNSIAIK